MTWSFCLNDTTCFDLVALFNKTHINSNFPLGQDPFSGYASSWLIGVVISSILILALVVWTAAQSGIREFLRKKAAVEIDPLDKDNRSIASQFMSSSVEIAKRKGVGKSVFSGKPTSERHLSSMSAANPDFEVMEIEFQHLSLMLMHGRGKTVLENVSGVLKPGTLTAVLGPSGCGKTSFLTAVAGRANYGKMGGVVKVNGAEQSIAKFRSLVGFVPQEDIMIRALTVRQILLFSARMRLPRFMSDQSKVLIVDGVIHVLGLESVQNQVIGDQTIRGISGGQRKRVNIGIELVSAPYALFLDEPTSGLDSSSAFKVVSDLVSLLSLNINIAAVMQQPRADIFQLFDRLLLLSDGGRTVFSGKRVLMVPYFETLGFSFDPKLNPADQVLDIISGIQLSDDSQSTHNFAELWDEFIAREHLHKRKPTVDDEHSLSEFQESLRARRAKLAEQDYITDCPTESPMQEIFQHSDSRRNKNVKALMAVVIQVIGIIICTTLLCVSFAFNKFVYLRVIVPYCTVSLALFVGTIITIGILTFRLSFSMDAMEKTLYFSAGTIFGPLAIVFCLAWQRRSKYYSYWLFLNMGAGAWITIVFSAVGTLLAMRANNYSEEWSFTTDVGVSWVLFVCAPFGFVILVASILRVVRKVDSTVREIASFMSQVWLHLFRCATEEWVRPSGLLLDLVLAVVSAIMIGITTPTSSRWTTPVLEFIAFATQDTFFPIQDCLPTMPAVLCQFISHPQSDPIFSNSQLVPLALGLIGVISSLRFFGLNKSNFRRENMAAVSTTALYLAKTLVSILASSISAAVFLSFWGFFVQPPANAGLYFLLIWLCLFSAHGLGFLVSICLRMELAGMLGVIVVLIFTLFNTTLSGQGGFQSFISYFSFINWASVALYTTSVAPFKATLTPWMFNVYGFSPSMSSFAWTQLFCLGVFMRLLAWLALVSKEV
jgi:ABC-type multidrug transport system ATPase subunit